MCRTMFSNITIEKEWVEYLDFFAKHKRLFAESAADNRLRSSPG